MSRLEGDMGSLRCYFSLPKYIHPIPPPVPSAPSVHHQMPYLNPEDCDYPTNEDGEDATEDDGA